MEIVLKIDWNDSPVGPFCGEHGEGFFFFGGGEAPVPNWDVPTANRKLIVKGDDHPPKFKRFITSTDFYS